MTAAKRITWRPKDEIDQLALENPKEYEELLQGFHLLIGSKESKALWWERVAEARLPAWKSCVRNAIMTVAREAQLSPKMLADWLDFAPLPNTRARILRIARERLGSR